MKNKMRYKTHKSKNISATCLICGNSFIEIIKDQKYCSKPCRIKSNKQDNGWDNTITTGTKGAIGEMFVCNDLLLRGYHVFRAISPSCVCDLVAIKQNKILRVEVTNGYQYQGKLRYPKHEEDRYDIMAVVLFGKKEIVYIPDTL